MEKIPKIKGKDSLCKMLFVYLCSQITVFTSVFYDLALKSLAKGRYVHKLFTYSIIHK